MIPQKNSFRARSSAWNWKRWGGPFLMGVVAISGCKNTPQGPVPIWNAPTNSTAPQSDPLFGPANNVSPPNQVAPSPAGSTPMISTMGAGAGLGSPQPSGPLPPLSAPNTISSPAALATGTTGQLNNPRDPYANFQPPNVPALSAPITNAPVPAATNQPGAIQLRQPENVPGNSWSAPPAGGFGPANPPPPSPPPGTINPSTSFMQQGQNSLNSLQNNLNNTAQQTQKDWNNLANSASSTANQYANSANATANQYKQTAVQTQQQVVNQGQQIQTNLNSTVGSSMDRLKQQLAQQGQAVDGAMQSSLTSLDESLRRQGMVWQNVQKQADGTWKSVASFADPNNPANRKTMEVVANTPEAAMRALLGEASGAPKPPVTGFPPPLTSK